MKSLLVIICAFLAFPILKAQDSPLLVLKLEVEQIECNKRIVREIKQKFISIHKDVAFVSNQSNIHHLYLSSETKSSNLLEGMDTYHYVELDVSINLKNLITGEAKTLILEGVGKSSNECLAIRKAYMNALSSNKEQIKELLTQFYSLSFNSNCESFVKEAELLNQNHQYRQALALLNNAPISSSCQSRISNVTSLIQENIAKESCEKEIHELTLLVNTKNIYQIKRNINRLLRIPPNAPCVEEAMEISKAIGVIFQEQNQKIPEDLNKFNLYIQNENNSTWRQGYIRN